MPLKKIIMSCIVSKAFLQLTDAKDRRFSCNCLAYCRQKSTKKHRIDTFLELKWLIPLFLSVLCASDNLDYILLQLTLYIKPQELRRLFVDPVSLQASLKHSCTSYGPLKD